MHFTIDQEDATTVFRLKEEKLNSLNASQLKAEFLILAQSDIDTLIIDLSEVKHVDSAGLSALLLADRQMSAHGGEVRLVGLNEEVLGLLKLTQLDRVFPIFESVDEAHDAEPSFGDEDDDDDQPITPGGSTIPGTTPQSPLMNSFGGVLPSVAYSPVTMATASDEIPLAPGAPSVGQIKAGAIAAGGSLGAAALAKIMMSPYEKNLDELNLLAFGDEEDFDDDEDDDFDDDLDEIDEEVVDEIDEEEDDLDEEDDAEDVGEEVVEDDEFEDDDFDDEELEEDDDDDF